MTDTIDNPTPNSAQRAGRRRMRLVLMLFVPALLLLAAGAFYLHGGRIVETDNAYVKADKVPVSPEVAGMVKEVLVQENQRVAAGQPLFRIDDAPFRLAVSRAEAKVAQARLDVGALKASYHEKQAEIQVARTKTSFAARDQQRQADLAARNFISAAKLDESRQNTDLNRQQVGALEQDLKRIAESLGGDPDLPLESHPGYKEALAELEQAKLDLSRVEVRAPMAGVVSKPPKPGQYLAPGSIALALVASGDLWVEANFTETDLTYVRPGQPVKVRVDTYPGVEWQGTVDSLSPATGAEFSLIPAQNATGNWVKIAQRVPLRIKLEPRADAPELRAGLSTVVEIDTGHKRRFLGLSL